MTELPEFFVCPECEKRYTKSTLDRNLSFFLTMPISNQLEDFINSSDYSMIDRNATTCSNLKDVTSGAYYKKLKDRNVIASNDLTLQLNTDGISPMRSSNYSIWPIQLMVNELPFNIRINKIFVCGIWYNRKKPNIDLFFKSIKDELNFLSTHGIKGIATGESIKIHLIMSSVDSVARPVLQEINQFNGKHGCSYCLVEGEILGPGTGNTRIYPGTAAAPLRNIKQHLRDGKLAIETNEAVNGVKGISLLSCIKTFDISQCFAYDYMHSCLLGVTKMFLDAWLDTTNHEEVWYLGRQIDAIDQILLNIEPPIEITRTPRSLHERAHWKAHEYKAFLLYYSFPCIISYMPEAVSKHWTYLIYAIYTFLKPDFSNEEFAKAERALHKFVAQVGDLYGRKFYRFNVHLLLHIPNSVKNFGALWATSNFPYESYNGLLSNMFFNSCGVPQQICKQYYRFQFLIHEYSKMINDMSAAGKQLFPLEVQPLFKRFRCRRFNTAVGNRSSLKEIYHTTQKKKILSSMILKTCIEEFLKLDQLSSDLAEVHFSVTVNGTKFHSIENNKFIKRNNSVVQLIDGRYIIIKNILTVEDTYVVEGELLAVIPRHVWVTGLIGEIYTAVKRTNITIVTSASNFRSKCILVSFTFSKDSNKYIVISLVNTLEVD